MVSTEVSTNGEAQTIDTDCQSLRRLRRIIINVHNDSYVILLYNVVLLGLSLGSISLTWCVVSDLELQVPGLVYGTPQKGTQILIIIVAGIEVCFFILELALWYDINKKKSISWMDLDFTSLLNSLITQIPLTGIFLRLNYCSDLTMSPSIPHKAYVVLISVIIRTVLLSCGVVARVSCENQPDTENADRSKMNDECCQRLLSDCETDSDDNCCPTSPLRILINSWGVVTFVTAICFFVLLLLNGMVQTTSNLPEFYGNSRWHKVDPRGKGSLEDNISEIYFHDVEIFMKASELEPHKWLHLVSIEKLMALQRQRIQEKVMIKYVTLGSAYYVLFGQLLVYPNQTTETSMTCWQVITPQQYKEAVCDEVITKDMEHVKEIKIQFTYTPPSQKARLGILHYNATTIHLKTPSSQPGLTFPSNYLDGWHPHSFLSLTPTRSGTTESMSDLRLKFFKNAVAHRSARPHTGPEGAVHNHDGWTSGPYREVNKTPIAGETHVPFDDTTNDLQPVSELWKTGTGRCYSNALLGPIHLTPSKQ